MIQLEMIKGPLSWGLLLLGIVTFALQKTLKKRLSKVDKVSLYIFQPTVTYNILHIAFLAASHLVRKVSAKVL